MASVSVAELGRAGISRRQSLWRYWRGGLRGSEFVWALAFLVPYIGVFFAFVIYPVCYGLWMGSKPGLYPRAVRRPDLPEHSHQHPDFSGFRGKPEAVFRAAAVGLLHAQGLVGQGPAAALCPALGGAGAARLHLDPLDAERRVGVHQQLPLSSSSTSKGPSWLNERWLALASAIYSHLWKWLPFWTVILLAGRMSIPQEIYDAAEVDGATGLKRFLYVTFPLLANLYLMLTLLATIFLLGDFNSVFFVTGGGPANSTHLVATLGIRNAFDLARPDYGVAAVMSFLPLMIPLVIILMRRMKNAQVQL